MLAKLGISHPLASRAKTARIPIESWRLRRYTKWGHFHQNGKQALE
jgi:hypothetical protein